MAKFCPMSGCKEKAGMCVHDKMMIGVVLMIVVIGGSYALFFKKDDVAKNATKQVASNSVADKNADQATVGLSDVQGGGSYEIYDPAKLAKANDGKVVLFFRASWCPSCKVLDADIRSHLNDIPKGVTILDVDYDKYADLKKKYGVVMQHTLVQVDADGKEIAKWGGSATLTDLVKDIE